MLGEMTYTFAQGCNRDQNYALISEITKKLDKRHETMVLKTLESSNKSLSSPVWGNKWGLFLV